MCYRRLRAVPSTDAREVNDERASSGAHRGPDAARGDIAQLIAGLAQSLPSEEFRTTLTAQVQELFAVHGRQWALEAACRDEARSLEEVGEIKQAIDRSNDRRVAIVNDIDSLPWPLSTPLSAHRVPCRWPVTVGQALDQLVIVVTKCEQIISVTSMAALREHHLATMLEMVEAMRGGRLVLPPVSTIKQYRTGV